MDTPGSMKGRYYATSRFARCPRFDQCEFCMGCTQKNPHSLTCQLCERIKPKEMLCHHTDAQQTTIVRVNQLVGMPMAHPDRASVPINIQTAGNEVLESLISDTHKGLGSITITEN